jgi:hypothetical protein
VVVWFWIRGYGSWVLLALMPCAWSFVLGQRLQSLSGAVAYGAALRKAGRAVALYAILFALGLML